MPIVFQQPSPFAPAINAGVGAMSVYEKQREFALRAQQQQFQQQQQIAQFQQQQRQYDEAPARAQQQAQTDLDKYLAMNQGALSQAEQMHFQELQQGDAWLDKQVADGVFEPEDALDAKMHTRKMIGYYQQRVQKAQAEQMQQHKQQMIDQAAMQQVVQNEAAKVDAMGVDERHRPVYADGSGSPGSAQPTPQNGPDVEARGGPGPDAEARGGFGPQFDPTGMALPPDAWPQAKGGPGPQDVQAKPDSRELIGHEHLVSVDPKTGKRVWKYEPAKPTSPQPNLRVIYDPETGERMGVFHVDEKGHPHPVKREAAEKPMAPPSTIVTKIAGEEKKVAEDSDALGEVKTYDMPGGGTMAFPATTRYRDLPKWAQKQEARRRVAERYEEATGETPSWANSPAAAPQTAVQAPATSPAATAAPLDAVQRANEIRKQRGLSGATPSTNESPSRTEIAGGVGMFGG